MQTIKSQHDKTSSVPYSFDGTCHFFPHFNILGNTIAKSTKHKDKPNQLTTEMTQQQLLGLDQRIEETRTALQQLKAENAQRSKQYKVQVQKLQHNITLLKRHLEPPPSIQVDRMTNKPLALSTYVSTVRMVMMAGEVSVPSSHYSLTLQGQVCRALHLLGTFQFQLDLLSHATTDRVLFIKTQSSMLQEDTTDMLIRRLNQIAMAHDTLRDFQTAYSRVVSLQCQIISSQRTRERRQLGYADQLIHCNDEDVRIAPTFTLTRIGGGLTTTTMNMMTCSSRRLLPNDIALKEKKEKIASSPVSAKTIRAIERFAIPLLPHVNSMTSIY